MRFASNKPFDLAVVGAGAYGAAVAYEAATRGLTTFLADKGDFGSGTSANSLKIVHGGLRYLQNFNIARARSSTHERSTFLRIAPGLVHPLKCVMPTGWERGKSRLVMGAGLALNAAVTFDRNRALPATQRLATGSILSSDEITRLAHGLHMGGVTGGASWYDAIMTDSERLCLALVMSARDAGASVNNHVSVERLLESGGSAVGVAVRDQITGSEHEIMARAVVSCQGPWAHAADKSPFGKIESSGLLKAVNVILPAAKLQCAVGFPPRDEIGQPKGSRLLFAVPWHCHTMVGTWYFPWTEGDNQPAISPGELDFMLHDLNSGFENWSFGREDVSKFHVGRLPANAADRSKPIDAPLVAECVRYGGLRDAWIVQGEKWCTARRTAQRAVEIIAADSGFELGKSKSSNTPLYSRPAGQQSGVPEDHDELLLYSLQNEMVRTLPDLMLRRTNIGAAGRPSQDVTDRISRLAASELGWDENERQKNVDAVHRHSLYPNDEIMGCG